MRLAGLEWIGGGTWRYRATYTRQDLAVGPVTHLKAGIDGVATGWVAVSDVTAGDVDISLVGPMLAAGTGAATRAVTATEVCDSLLFSPNTDPDSLPPAYKLCEQLRLHGIATAELVSRLGMRFGPAAVDVALAGLAASHVLDPQAPNPLAELSTVLERDLQQRVDRDRWVDDALRDGATLPDEQQIPVLADECRTQVQQAVAILQDGGRHPCDDHHLFITGEETYEASDVNHRAIAQWPDLMRLHYVSQANKQSALSRQWYRSVDPSTGVPWCDTQLPLSCQEYPFFSSYEGGPPRALAEPVNAAHNEIEGSRYGSFILRCKLISGVATAPEPNGTPFLVLAVPHLPGSATQGLCRS